MATYRFTLPSGTSIIAVRDETVDPGDVVDVYGAKYLAVASLPYHDPIHGPTINVLLEDANQG